MKKQAFFFEIKNNMIQFVRALDDIIINRYNNNREVEDRLQVRYVYAPKQKVIHDLTNLAKHITLPVVACNITGIERDNERVFNKILGHYPRQDNPNSLSGTETKKSDYIPSPVPINITVSVSILAKYQSDIEQIFSNFVPYVNPYFIISWKIPSEFTAREQEIRTEVLWNGGLNIDYPTEMAATENFRVAADTSFTIKGWLFKAVETPVSNILEIQTNWHSVSGVDGLSEDLTTTDSLTTFNESLSSSIGVDQLFCRISPQITYIDPISSCMVTGLSAPFNVLGYSLGHSFGVFVSGGIFQYPSSEHNLFDTTALSATFPSFTGIETNFNIHNDNYITFDMPPVSGSGDVNVIIVNKAGYAKVGTDSTQTELIHITNI